MGKTLPSVCLEHGTGKRMARTQASWSWFCRLRTFFTLGHMEEERQEAGHPVGSSGDAKRKQAEGKCPWSSGPGGNSLTVLRELAPWNPTQSLGCWGVAGEPLRKRALEPFTRAHGTRGKMALKSSTWGLSIPGTQRAVGAQLWCEPKKPEQACSFRSVSARGPFSMRVPGGRCGQIDVSRGNRGLCYSQPDKADPTETPLPRPLI